MPPPHPTLAPQVFQDLEVGDLVITRDFKGAGCWTAFPSPLPDERLYLALRKNGTDTSGLGILHKDLAPPSLPLFFFSDANIDEELMDKQALVDKQVGCAAWQQGCAAQRQGCVAWQQGCTAAVGV